MEPVSGWGRGIGGDLYSGFGSIRGEVDVDIDQLGKTADSEAGAAARRRQTPCVDTSRCSPFSGRLLGDPDRI